MFTKRSPLWSIVLSPILYVVYAAELRSLWLNGKNYYADHHEIIIDSGINREIV